MKKHINTIGIIMQWAGGISFVASFFVEDNKKAVHYRYLGVGLAVGGTIARFATISGNASPASNKKSKTEYEVHAYDNKGELRNPIFSSKYAAENQMANYKKLGYTRISLAPIYNK